MNKLTAYAEEEFVDQAAEMEMCFTLVTSDVSIQRFKFNLWAKLEYHIKRMRIKHRFHPTSQREQNRHFLVNWH